MNFTDILGSLIHKKSEQKETYISLYLDVYDVAVSFFSLSQNGSPEIEGSVSEKIPTDSWDSRIEAVDRLIGVLEEKTGLTAASKVILGLPGCYLTATGEIQKQIKIEIKELAKLLELEPIGFVPLHQALIYKIKKDEGIPPSVILLGLSDKTIAMSLYKIGILSGLREIEKSDNIAASVEQGIKSFTDIEVLPARMLLYGADEATSEEVKSELLRYPWTSKANFLHFPKIDIISTAYIIESISLAGASELGSGVDLSGENEAAGVTEQIEHTDEEQAEESLTDEAEEVAVSAAPEVSADDDTEDENIHVSVADETPELERTKPVSEAVIEEEVLEAQKDIDEDFSVEERSEEDANVVMVDAKSLGFQKNVDILEKQPEVSGKTEEIEENEEVYDRESAFGTSSVIDTLPKLSLPKILAGFAGGLRSFSQKTRGGIVTIVIGILIALLGLLYWLLPHATVVVLQIPKTISTSQTITIDPTTTTVDAQNKIIPGKTIEKPVSEEKTIAVNGKKDIGDPAKGTVTIYNKTLTSQTLNKGTVLTSGSLKFVLDATTSVQAATVTGTLGMETKTFGQTTSAITASAIGPGSNMAANTAFAISGFSSDEMVANNTQALTGGSSKQITVVARSDYDALLKAASADLIANAKQNLSTAVGGDQKLIDQTVTTTVSEKVFNQEIDQQATQLQGKFTMTISGIAYSENDVRALLITTLGDAIPSGYTLSQDRTTIVVQSIQTKKDGTIVAKISMDGVALPVVDLGVIRKTITGKTLSQAQEYLKTIPGVAGLEVIYRLNPTKNRLPLNTQNISVSLKVLP